MNVRALGIRARSELPDLAIDSILAGVLIAAQLVINPSQPLLGLAILPVAFRRRLPLVAAVVMGTFFALGEILAPWGEDPSLPVIAAILITLYSVGAHEASLPWSIVGGLTLGVGARTDLVLNGPGTDTFWPFTILYMGGAWLAGRIVHQRRRDAEDLSAQARLLRDEQDLRTSEAVAEERGRLARELHDVIAHNVSLMVVQAGAAEQVLENSPQEVREALRWIQESGRQTVVELRRLLGVLRHHDQELGTTPRPSLGAIESLLDQFRRSGLDVDLTVEGHPRPLPVSLDLSAYRVVQEGLTNTLRHADAGKAEVIIRYSRRGLDLEITDDGSGARGNGSWGHGLLGIRERVALFNGTMEAGNRPEGGFTLRAFLGNESESAWSKS
jgi:signal transduction histidine kinase